MFSKPCQHSSCLAVCCGCRYCWLFLEDRLLLQCSVKFKRFYLFPPLLCVLVMKAWFQYLNASWDSSVSFSNTRPFHFLCVLKMFLYKLVDDGDDDDEYVSISVLNFGPCHSSFDMITLIPLKSFFFLTGTEPKCPQEVTILAWNRLHWW